MFINQNNMKFINKFLLVIALFLVGSSCENLTELDLLDNPNAATPDRANINDLYNNIQLEFRNVFRNTNGIGEGMSRLVALGRGQNQQNTYQAAFRDTDFNGIWNNFYADFLQDVKALQVIAEERGLDVHGGTAKIMQAYGMLVMVDLFGSVPFSQAGQGTEVISPTADSGEDIYNQAK
jgi:hypothetical protein